MQKRYLFVIVCFLIISNAFANVQPDSEPEKTPDDFEVSDVSEDEPEITPDDFEVSDVSEDEPEITPDDFKASDVSEEKPEKTPDVSEEKKKVVFPSQLDMEKKHGHKLKKLTPFYQTKRIKERAHENTHVTPIEINNIDHLYDCFLVKQIPNILVVYEDKPKAEKVISGVLNQLHSWEGLLKIYLLQCSWLTELQERVDDIQGLDLKSLETECSESEKLPQIHLSYAQYNKNAVGKENQFSATSSTFQGAGHHFKEFIDIKYPNYSKRITSYKSFKRWLGSNKKRIFVFYKQDYTLKIIAGLSAKYAGVFQVAYMRGAQDAKVAETLGLKQYPHFYFLEKKNGTIDIQSANIKPWSTFQDVDKMFFTKFVGESSEEGKITKENQNQDEKEIQLQKDALIKITPQNYEYYIFQDYKATFLHVRNNEQSFQKWDMMQQNYRHMFTFAEINCDSGFNRYICFHLFKNPEEPSVLLFKAGKLKRKKPIKIYEKHSWEEIHDRVELAFDRTPHIKNIKKGQIKKAYKLVSDTLKEKNMCALFMHNKHNVPIVWKAIASNLNRQYRYKYAYYSEPAKEFLKQFNLDYFDPPFLVVFGFTNQNTDSNKDYKSKGEKKMEATFSTFKDRFTYFQIDQWMKEVFQNHLKPKRPAFKNAVQIIYTKEDLIEKCISISAPDDICIFGIQDGSHTISIQSQLYQIFMKAAKTVGKQGQFHYFWIDTHAHKELYNYFALEEEYLPTIAAYQPSTKLGFQQEVQDKKWNVKSLKRFVFNVLENDLSLLQIDKGPLEDFVKGDMFKTYLPPKIVYKEPIPEEEVQQQDSQEEEVQETQEVAKEPEEVKETKAEATDEETIELDFESDDTKADL